MRLLMLTVVPPAADPRARRAAAAAAERAIEVATVSIAGPARRRPPRPQGRSILTRELRGMVRLVRLARTTLRLTRRARSSAVEIVHAHDLDSLPAGAIVARRQRARLVYDAHELYTGFDRDPPRLWLALITRLERALARRADAVVTVSDEIAEHLAALHRLDRRPYVVLNAPPLAQLEVTEREGPLRAIYQAAVGPGRHLDDLPAVDGVEISARVLGATAAPSHVRLLEPVAPEETMRGLADFDVGLVIDRPETENTRLALPNKLFEYLMAGLAVVVPHAPAMARLIEEQRVGRTYESGRLHEVLRELAEDRPAVEAMRRRARAAAVERYNAVAQRPALYAAWGL